MDVPLPVFHVTVTQIVRAANLGITDIGVHRHVRDALKINVIKPRVLV